jgi:hypothetical protein
MVCANVFVNKGEDVVKGKASCALLEQRSESGFRDRIPSGSLVSRTNVFSGSYVYELPTFGSFTGVRGGFINGWTISGVVIVESGLLFNVTDCRAGTILGISGSQAQFAPGMGPGKHFFCNR